MGLFSAFGVGGGSLSLELQFQQVQAGGAVQGNVVFTGGKRAQQITTVTLSLSCTLQQPGPNGPQSQSQPVFGPLQVAGAFAAQPGQRYAMPFQVALPQGLYGSAPGLVSYRLSASADIDGEIDPGAGIDLFVQGEAFQPAMPAMMPMGGPTYPQKADPYGKGADPYAQKLDPYGKGAADPYAKGSSDPYAQKLDPYGKGAADPYGKGAADPYGKASFGGGFQPGDRCVAPWSNGAFYPATVLQANGGSLYVQWDDGSAPMWVDASQVQPA